MQRNGGEVVDASDDFRCCFGGDVMEGKGTAARLLIQATRLLIQTRPAFDRPALLLCWLNAASDDVGDVWPLWWSNGA